MTAQQLTARATGFTGPSISPRVRDPSSPYSGSIYSTTPASPTKTPKAGLAYRSPINGSGIPSVTPTKSRPPSNGTPRGRIPSSVAMPPPPSPIARSISASIDDFKHASAPEDDGVDTSDLISNGQSLPDKVALLASGKSSSPSSSRARTPSSPAAVLTNDVQYLNASTSGQPLQLKVNNLQSDNDLLKDSVDKLEKRHMDSMQLAETLRAERDGALARVSTLENSAKTAERAANEQFVKLEALERALANTTADMEKIRTDREARIRDLQSQLDDKETLVQNLKAAVEQKEGLESEADAVLKAKNAEIGLLEARVKKAYAELEADRKELGSQVDELRQAGQARHFPSI